MLNDPTAVEIFAFYRGGVQPLYLVLHNAPGKRFAGCWCPVAGSIMSDELPVLIALRELYQQTQLQAMQIWSLDYMHSYYDPLENISRHIQVFAVEVASNGLKLSDAHDASRWITYDQASLILRFPSHREGLKRTYDDVVSASDHGAPFRVTLNG